MIRYFYGSYPDLTVASMALTVNLLLSAVPSIYLATSKAIAYVVSKVRDSVSKEGWDLKVASVKEGPYGDAFVKACQALVDVVGKYETRLDNLCPISSVIFRVMMIMSAILAVGMGVMDNRSHLALLLFLPYPLFTIWCGFVGVFMMVRLLYVKWNVTRTEAKMPLDHPVDLEERKKKALAGMKKIAKKGVRRNDGK